MKMCLAPCFKGCSDEEYVAEVNRVQAYFDSGGDSLIRELSTEREAASARLAFEDAAAIHARVEKLKPIVGQLPEIVQRLDRLSALMIQPSHIAGSVTFFRIEAGAIAGPIPFCIQSAEHAKSQSMESRVQQAMDLFPLAKTRAALETMEHLALLKRWYYRAEVKRTGEICFPDTEGHWPIRTILRSVGRVAAKSLAAPLPPT
jgi:excinuclease UvrABC nuclease subunit